MSLTGPDGNPIGNEQSPRPYVTILREDNGSTRVETNLDVMSALMFMLTVTTQQFIKLHQASSNPRIVAPDEDAVIAAARGEL